GRLKHLDSAPHHLLRERRELNPLNQKHILFASLHCCFRLRNSLPTREFKSPTY
ncbi:hypothetical protein SUGI_0295450, partial [Cryptomeria japonica]